MKKIVIFSIMGYKGVGKDTFANNVKGFIDNKFKDVVCEKLNLADPLKEFISKSFNYCFEDIELLKRKEDIKIINGLSMREVLINISENFKKTHSVNIWSDLLIQRIDNIITKNKDKNKFIFIVPDLRYKSEYEVFEDMEDIYSNVKYLNIKLALEGYKPVNLDKSEQEFLTIPVDITIDVTNRNMFNDYVDLIGKNCYLLLNS